MRHTLSIALLAIALLTSSSLSSARAQHFNSFSEAQAHAKQSSTPFIVLIHGASWHPASKRYLDTIWKNVTANSALSYTEIHIGQQLDETAQKAQQELNKEWKQDSVKSYPAIQFYSPSGQLLKTYQGESMRLLGSEKLLTQHLEHLTKAHQQWASLWQQFEQQESTNADSQQRIATLAQILELPIDTDSKALDTLKLLDPKDASGFVGRYGLNQWTFMRDISKLASESKFQEAHQQLEPLLNNSKLIQQQRAFIQGTKGRLLVAEGKLEEAYQCFQNVEKLNDLSPDTRAILAYGKRETTVPLRYALPTQSTLSGKNLGDNISRTNTTAVASSGPQENIAKLFYGKPTKEGFAFHTDKELKPTLVIDLHTECLVNALYIENRPGFLGRSQNLTLWISNDGNDWKQIWQATESKPFWDIDLTSIERTGYTTRYLKLNLEHQSADFFHLNRIDILGKRP